MRDHLTDMKYTKYPLLQRKRKASTIIFEKKEINFSGRNKLIVSETKLIKYLTESLFASSSSVKGKNFPGHNSHRDWQCCILPKDLVSLKRFLKWKFPSHWNVLLTKVTTNTNDLAVPIAQPVQFGRQQLKGNIASWRSEQNKKGNNIQK